MIFTQLSPTWLYLLPYVTQDPSRNYEPSQQGFQFFLGFSLILTCIVLVLLLFKHFGATISALCSTPSVVGADVSVTYLPTLCRWYSLVLFSTRNHRVHFVITLSKGISKSFVPYFEIFSEMWDIIEMPEMLVSLFNYSKICSQNTIHTIIVSTLESFVTQDVSDASKIPDCPATALFMESILH